MFVFCTNSIYWPTNTKCPRDFSLYYANPFSLDIPIPRKLAVNLNAIYSTFFENTFFSSCPSCLIFVTFWINTFNIKNLQLKRASLWSLLTIIIVYTITLKYPIFAIRYFLLFKLKVFSNRLPLVCLTFHVQVSHSKEAAVFSFLPFQFYPLPREQLFSLIRSSLSRNFFDPFLYLPFVYKQFSIDSFLDWEGHR